MPALSTTSPRLPAWFIGEFVGTFLLVFFGCGAVAAAVLTGAQVGVFQVAIVWGIAVSTAIYLAGSLSGAHLNPAVTIAFAIFGDFPAARVPRYLVAQFAGAFAASAALYVAFHGPLLAYEAAHAIVRGAPGSEASAMIFGEYFPNPRGLPLTDALRATVTPLTAFFIETLATALLALVIFGCTDEKNSSRPRTLTPIAIGLTVTVLISLFGPLTMAGLNPARDLAPRLFSALAGWGAVPFTANGLGWLTVYVLAPVLGALLGGGAYRLFLAPLYRALPPERPESP
jgi:glycerol uptake facilitator protein